MYPNQPNYGYTQSYGRPNNRRKTIIISALAGVFIVLLALVILPKLTPKKDPVSRATKFAQLVRDGKAAESYSMTTENFRKTTKQDSWNDLVSRINKNFIEDPKFKDIEKVTSVDPNIELHDVTFLAEGEEGLYRLTVQLKKTDKEYQVEYFNSRVELFRKK